MNSPIKMEVGIEDCLHIEFEYNKSKYHLKDVIVGKIYFLLVRIKIKHMEIAIIKRETTGAGESPSIITHDNFIQMIFFCRLKCFYGERDDSKVRDNGWSASKGREHSDSRFSRRLRSYADDA